MTNTISGLFGSQGEAAVRGHSPSKSLETETDVQMEVALFLVGKLWDQECYGTPAIRYSMNLEY